MTSTNETLDMAKNSLRKRFNSNSLHRGYFHLISGKGKRQT